MIVYQEIKDMTDGGVAIETDYLAAQRGAEAKRLSLAQLRQHINLRNYEPALLYLSGAATLYNGQLYHANKNTQGTFKPADWDEVVPTSNNTELNGTGRVVYADQIGGGIIYKVVSGTRLVVPNGFVVQWTYNLPLEVHVGAELVIEEGGYIVPPAGSNILNNGTIINNGIIDTQGGSMEGGTGDYGGSGDLF